MTKDYFIKLAKYNQWANESIINWLMQIPEKQWNATLNSSMPSLAATVTHIAGAEKIWHERLQNITNPFLANNFASDKYTLFQIWQKATSDLLITIEKTSEIDFQNVITYKNIKGEEFTSQLYEILAHVFNHSTYHRGQIVNYLRQVGFTEVSSTDLINYFRKTKS